MKILALEFSSGRRSVALVKATAGQQPVHVAAASEVGARSTKAFELISKVLRDAAWAREDVDAIAVGLGPGSYHGIRVAIAIAEGWSIAKKTRLIGISSADSLAAMLVLKGQQKPFTVVIDAQRGEFYRADYTVEAGTAKKTGDLRLVKAHEITDALHTGKIVCGPDLSTRLPGVQEAFPEALTVGYLAANMPPDASNPPLEPIYLREAAFVKAKPPRFE